MGGGHLADSNTTKRMLAQTLKQQMAHMPFSKIRVSEICAACGVSRKSIYYHFRDKYDLVDWIFRSEFISKVRPDRYENAWAFLEDICAYFYRERVFYSAVIKIYGQNSFLESFSETMEPFMQNFLRQIICSAHNSEFAQNFLTDAFLCSLVRWLRGPDILPPERYLDHLRQLLVDLSHHILFLEGIDTPSKKENA